ncbi:MAG: hypothetical protein ACRYG4_23305 [Janthinobacterium lividum]
MSVEIEDQAERIGALAEQLRASGKLGRSELTNGLFDFLLKQSIAGRSPKEVEVAQEVFGKDARFDMSQDASVRVYIHRLRRRLEEIYGSATGERLVIPRGEYRLSIVTPFEAASPEIGAVDPIPATAAPAVDDRFWRRSRRPKILLGLIAALAAGALLGAAAWDRLAPYFAEDAIARTSFWHPLAISRRPTFVVVGDYYIFGEAPDGMQVTRLVREFSINSRNELDQYLMAHPALSERYLDLDLHYLPTSAGPALADLLPRMSGFAGGRARVIGMSQLAPEILKGFNIVYVGFLSSLGVLRDPLFEASGFSVGASYDELIDQATGKHYVSDWEEVAGNRTPRRDYGYLASFPGPSGNRILIVAGTRDPAVMQTAEIAADKVQLDQIAARAGNTGAFEALYEVRTLGPLNLGSTLVLARPLKVAGLWRAGGNHRHFPDEFPGTGLENNLAEPQPKPPLHP